MTRAWLALVLLALGTVAATTLPRGALIPVVCLIATLKARVILSHYLGLCAAPSWNRGLTFAVALLMATSAALALI